MSIRLVNILLLVIVLVLPATLYASSTTPASPYWQRHDSLLFLGGMAAVGLTMLADKSIDDHTRSHQSSDLANMADVLHVAGHPLTTFSVAGGMLAYGWWNKDVTRMTKGCVALESVVVSQIVTLGLKAVSGRHRPDGENGSGTYSPFSFDTDKDSFPSGHTAGAFALASALVDESSSAGSRYGYYALAGLIGASRIYRGDHWASDVVAGALIGELAGRMVKRAHAGRDRTFLLLPWLNGGPGFQLARRF
mgnify:CR=1 FL=1